MAELGRRAGFRCPWGQPRGGSSPLIRILSSSPHPRRIVLAAPVYNGASYLAEALESVLAQTHTDFALLVCDDRSSDASPEIAAAFAARDERIEIVPAVERLGLARNWQRCLDEAERRHPGHAYFAWLSDHDVWDPGWLAALVRVLDADASVVTAAARVETIAVDGTPLGPAPLVSFEQATPAARVAALARDRGSGSLVYGLHRASALRETVGFRRVLAPDALLMAQLAALGRIRVVPEAVWRRRMTSSADWARQRRNFLPEGHDLRASMAMRVPPATATTAALAWSFAVRGSADGLTRSQGAAAAAAHAAARLRITAGRAYGRLRDRARARG